MAVVASAEAGRRAAGRATVLQLRAPHLSTSRLEVEASRLIGSVDIPVVVSSRCDVALACDAAGVNLPERDVPTADARRLLGEALVGRSVHSLESAMRAEREGADYVIFGPVWRSTSHRGVQPVGTGELARVARALRIPVLAIGGVTEERISECAAAGAAGYAAIGLFS
jgi:thiamine-phosphate pyrophosphorylase